MRLGALVGSVSVLALVTVSTRVAEHAPVASQIKSALATDVDMLAALVEMAATSTDDAYLAQSSFIDDPEDEYELSSMFRWPLKTIFKRIATIVKGDVVGFLAGLIDYTNGNPSSWDANHAIEEGVDQAIDASAGTTVACILDITPCSIN